MKLVAMHMHGNATFEDQTKTMFTKRKHISTSLIPNTNNCTGYCVEIQLLVQTGTRVSLFIFTSLPTAWANTFVIHSSPYVRWPYSSRKIRCCSYYCIQYWRFYGNVQSGAYELPEGPFRWLMIQILGTNSPICTVAIAGLSNICSLRLIHCSMFLQYH